MLTLLLVLIVLALLFGGYGHGEGWGYWGWSPLGLLVLVFLLFVLFGAAHAQSEVANIPWDRPSVLLANIPWDRPSVVLGNIPWDRPAFVLFGGMVAARSDRETRAGPPGLPFNISYVLGVIVTVLLAGAAWIAGQYNAGHGADLPFNLGTPQGFATVMLLSVMLGALGRLLPNVQHTPKFRRRELLQARRGLLPPDLHRSDRPGGEPAGP